MHKTLRNGVWLRMQNIFQKSIILKQLWFKTKTCEEQLHARFHLQMTENDDKEAIKL